MQKLAVGLLQNGGSLVPQEGTLSGSGIFEVQGGSANLIFSLVSLCVYV